jgi:hypothetical protein
MFQNQVLAKKTKNVQEAMAAFAAANLIASKT